MSAQSEPKPETPNSADDVTKRDTIDTDRGGCTVPTPVTTMSSREIAEMAGARHNDVIGTLDRLFDKGLLRSSRKSRQELTGGRPIEVYDLNARDTYLVIAGYSDEVRAKIIDRWLELESKPKPVGILDQIDTARVVYIGPKHDLSAAGIYYAALEAKLLGPVYVAKKYGVLREFVNSIMRLKDAELRALEKRAGSGASEMSADALKLRASRGDLKMLGAKP